MTARPAAAQPENGSRDCTRLCGEYVRAQLAGDKREAIDLVVRGGIETGFSAADLMLDVIQPAQYEIGRLWEAQEITVAQEHLATAISQLVVTRLYQHIEFAPPKRGLIVVACPAGELHDLGARIASDFLEMAGFKTHYLGANVPSQSLATMVRKRHPAALVLSAASDLCFDALKETLHCIHQEDDEMPIFVGGNAFAGSVAHGIPADVVHAGRNARELVAEVTLRLRD